MLILGGFFFRRKRRFNFFGDCHLNPP
ncbi:hypothetical protein [Liquorilactobacillus sicerae]